MRNIRKCTIQSEYNIKLINEKLNEVRNVIFKHAWIQSIWNLSNVSFISKRSLMVRTRTKPHVTHRVSWIVNFKKIIH